MKKVLVFGLIILLFASFTTTVATAASASDKPFYYFQGKKQELKPTKWVAVRLIDGADINRLILEQLTGCLFGERKFIEEQQLWLLEYKTPVNSNILVKRIASHPSVQFAVPVYSHNKEKLIATDELIVKEKSSELSHTDIIMFAYSHSYFLARFGPLPQTLILKATNQAQLSVLEMANLYVEEGLAEYAQPNFMRIFSR